MAHREKKACTCGLAQPYVEARVLGERGCNLSGLSGEAGRAVFALAESDAKPCKRHGARVTDRV